MRYTSFFQSENGSVDNEVFGSHLNKQKVLVKTHSAVEEREEKRRGSTWKLRQWTKGEGYRTVQGGGTVSGHCSQNGRTENSDTGAHKTFDREDCSCKEDVTASSTAKKENEVYTCTLQDFKNCRKAKFMNSVFHCSPLMSMQN